MFGTIPKSSLKAIIGDMKFYEWIKNKKIRMQDRYDISAMLNRTYMKPYIWKTIGVLDKERMFRFYSGLLKLKSVYEARKYTFLGKLTDEEKAYLMAVIPDTIIGKRIRGKITNKFFEFAGVHEKGIDMKNGKLLVIDLTKCPDYKRYIAVASDFMAVRKRKNTLIGEAADIKEVIAAAMEMYGIDHEELPMAQSEYLESLCKD